MTQLPMQGQTVEVKPQPTVYTALIIVACLALAVAIGFAMYALMSPVEAGGYGMTFGELLQPLKDVPAAPK